MSRFRTGTCFVLQGDEDKFSELVTLQDIEERLNDGCNLNSPVVVVDADEQRRALVDREVSWSSVAVEKSAVLERFADGQALVMANLSQMNTRVARLLDELEDALSDDAVHADVCLRISVGDHSGPRQATRDYPQHNIHLQVAGITEWRVYHHDPSVPGYLRTVAPADERRYLEEAASFTLRAGDMFYMPPAVFHKVRYFTGPQISLTVPLTAADQRHRMDRTYIPLKALYLSAAEKRRSA